MDDELLGEPRHVLLNLDEVYAVFFLPLPDPLALADKQEIPTYGAIDVPTSQSIIDSGVAFVTKPLEARGRAEIAPIDVQAIEKWFHYCTFLSSLMVRHVETDVWARTAFDAANIVMRANFLHDEAPLSTLDQAGVTWSEAPRPPREQGVGQVTIIEAVVPLRIVGEVPVLPHPVLDISERQLQTAEWPYTAELPKDLAPRLSMALEYAVSDIHAFQRSYHAVTGDPITLLTRERLPTFVPLILRKHGPNDDGPGAWAHGIVQANDNFRAIITPPTLSDDQLADVARARPRIAGSAPFVASLDIYREAKVALHRHGDTRIAAILCGVTSESLLDELLLHMIWEEGAYPEDVAGSWPDSLKSRVKREYASRLGGQWDLRAPNQVTRWHDDVAQLRHRVVHGTYVPTRGEATLALSRLDELLAFLVDRLLNKRNLSKYPRTAWMLAGARTFEERKVRSPELVALMADPSQPNWDETFVRWRETVTRRRRDKEHPRVPDPAAAFLYAVRHPNGMLTWCLHDRAQHLAARVTVDESMLPSDKFVDLRSKLDELSQIDPQKAVSFGLDRDAGPSVEIAGPWVEEYHLVPLSGVMVNQNDLDSGPRASTGSGSAP
ncbi:hypothetical protein [Georgenia sp. Marseille-Q6866]